MWREKLRAAAMATRVLTTTQQRVQTTPLKGHGPRKRGAKLPVAAAATAPIPAGEPDAVAATGSLAPRLRGTCPLSGVVCTLCCVVVSTRVAIAAARSFSLHNVRYPSPRPNSAVAALTTPRIYGFHEEGEVTGHTSLGFAGRGGGDDTGFEESVSHLVFEAAILRIPCPCTPLYVRFLAWGCAGAHTCGEYEDHANRKGGPSGRVVL